MHYIFEAIIVGIYSVIIFFISSFFINSYNHNFIQLFIVGFFKHFLSGYLKIHDFYCNYGYSCYLNNDCKNGKCYANKDLLFFESLIEGILYLIVGFILIEISHSYLFLFFNFSKNIYLYFLIGFILHLSFEYLQIHKYFCNTHCQKI